MNEGEKRRVELETTYRKLSDTKLTSSLDRFLKILREAVEKGNHQTIDFAKEVRDVIKEEQARRCRGIHA